MVSVEREAVVQGLPNLLQRGSGLTQPKFVFTKIYVKSELGAAVTKVTIDPIYVVLRCGLNIKKEIYITVNLSDTSVLNQSPKVSL